MMSRNISVTTGEQRLLPSMHGLGHGIRANPVNLFGTGTPMWFVASVEGPILLFQTSRWFSYFSSRLSLTIFRKTEPKMCTIWHQMLRIASFSGAETQLRSLRRSPHFLPSRNSQSQHRVFRACSYPTWTFE